MKKRILSLLLATILSVSFVGCSKAPQTPNATKAVEVDPKEQKTAKEPETSEPVTLRYATWDFTATAYMQEAVKVFNETHPNIKVEPMEIASNEYSDKINVMMSGGEDVDIIDIKDIPVYANYVNLGRLEDLTEYMAKDNIDISSYSGSEAPLYVDKKIYGLPYRSDHYVLFFNKGLFDAAKVPYPTNDMTLNDFRELAKKMTSGEAGNKIHGAFLHTWASQVFNYGIASGEHSVVDGDNAFLLPAYKNFLAMQNEDKSVLPFAEIKTANLHYSGAFGNGSSAMLVMGTWYISRLIDENSTGKIDVDWGMVKMPHEEGLTAGTAAGVLTPVAINSKSKNKEAAWEFVKFLSGAEGATILAGKGAKPAYFTDEVKNIYSNVDGFPKGSEEALITSHVSIDIPPHLQAAAIKSVFEETHSLIMIGELTPEKGVEELDKRVQEILKESK